MRAVGEAATRTGKTEIPVLRAYILSDEFTVAGFKGEGLTFRRWDHQLRQPMLITGARSLVSMSPQEGFLHEKYLTDTLGYDEPETKCSSPTDTQEKVPEMKRPILTGDHRRLLIFAASPLAAQIFVSNEKDNTVTVVDGKTLEVVKTIPTARRPRGIIASPDGKEVYVAAGDGDIIDVIDTEKLEVVRQLDSGPDPELMAVDPKGGRLYIANEDDHGHRHGDQERRRERGDARRCRARRHGCKSGPKYTVATSESTSMAHVIDNATEKLVANVLVDTRPREAKFTPDGKQVWVSSEVGGTVSVIDTTT